MAGEVQDIDPTDANPDFDQNPVSTVDTQISQPATPANDVSGHVEQQTPTSTPAPEGTLPEGQPDEAKIQAALREYGKLSQVQKELDQTKEDIQRLRNIEAKAIKSPESYMRALIEYSDYTEADARAKVEELKGQGFWQQPVTPAQTAPNTGQYPQQTSPYGNKSVDEIVDLKIQQREQARALQEAFFEKVPALDPRNLAPEKIQGARTLAAAVEYEARRRVMEDPKINLVDELVSVYKEFTGQTEDSIEQAKETGREEGYLEAQTNKSTVNKPAKGYSPKESSFGLTSEELRQAQEEGFTPEEFAKLKNPVSSVG